MTLFGLFGKKKRTLRDLTLDDLKREQLGLKQEQRKLDLEAERLDKDESQLTSEYSQAQSPTQKKAVARKIQDVRMRKKAIDTNASHCHKMLQTVNNFSLIKENEAFFVRMGVSSVLMNMDVSEIEGFVNEATINGQLQQDKLATMLRQVSDGAEQMMEASADGSLDDLMQELDQKSAAPRLAKTADADVGALMSELDVAISKGQQLARETQSQAKAPSKQPEQER